MKFPYIVLPPGELSCENIRNLHAVSELKRDRKESGIDGNSGDEEGNLFLWVFKIISRVLA